MAQMEMSGQTFKQGMKVSDDGGRTRELFGLFELDLTGTVLYMRQEPDGGMLSGSAPDYTGRNFYNEVALFSNVGEFRRQLDGFGQGTQPIHIMNFTCDYEDGPVLVRVLLARIRERLEMDATKSILVHIRRVC